MLIKDLYTNERPLLSFEVFPPKKEDSFPQIYEELKELSTLNPDFISVTYGAGGSNSKKTASIASYIKNELRIEALAHMTCVGMTEQDLSTSCEHLLSENVTNILALRGDRPKTMDDATYERKFFPHASDMTAYIRKHFSTICIGGACYPEKHFEADTMQEDLLHLKEKINAGCDFLITQLFFENEAFYRFYDKLYTVGIDTPISVGIMPITRASQLGTTITLSGSTIPKEMADMIARYPKPEDFRKAGIDYAIRQINDLLDHGVDGIHIYTMNHASTAVDIISNISIR